jgi:hypothetical protein
MEYDQTTNKNRRECMEIKLTAVFRKAAEGYIGFVEELPGANTHLVKHGPMMCSGKREKPYARLPPEGSSMDETTGDGTGLVRIKMTFILVED